MPSVVLDNVVKRYEQETALAGVSLAIPEKIITAIVGPSGSGKSTLLQTINGLVRPDAGTIEVFGQPIDYAHIETLRRRIGYAVQGIGLFPHMKAWRNITLLAEFEGWERERIEKRGRELMALVGLDERYASRYPHELSGGQQQRVGLCRAMMLNPPLFLLDEPFAAVDPITREEIHDELLKAQGIEPRSIVIVTHDIREALALGQYLVIMDRGRILQQGDRTHVLANPGSDFIRRLFEKYAKA